MPNIEVVINKRVQIDEEAGQQLIVDFLAWATDSRHAYLLDSPDAELDGRVDWSHDHLVAAYLARRR